MATISASQEEMRAAITTVRSAQANSEVTFSKWIEVILVSNNWRIQSLCEELSRHKTCIMYLKKIQQTNTMVDAIKCGPETKLGKPNTEHVVEAAGT
jgi:hypothetical protein